MNLILLTKKHCLSVFLIFLIYNLGYSQNVDATWGANAGTAWYTVGNWSGGAYPGLQGVAASNTNTATFTSAATATGFGINITTGSLNLGALSVDATRSIATTIGNSTATTGGFLRLYGATVNSVSNVIVRNAGSSLLTLAPTSGGTAAMGYVLSNATNNIINIDGAGGVTVSAIISGTGPLTKAGSGTGNLILSGLNTYTGATNVTTGTLQLGAAGVIPDASALTVNGTLDMKGFNETVGSLAGTGVVTNTTATAETLTVGGDGTSTTYSGTIIAGSGSIALTKSGAGTLTLSGTNTYIGLTSISAGTIKLGNTAALGTTAGATTVSSGATLDLNGLSIAEPLTLSGTLTNSNSTAATESANITLTTAAIVNTNNPITLSGIISSTGTLTKTGTGTLTLSGANTYTGSTTITAGILQIAATERIANTDAIALNGGTLSTGATTGFSETVGVLTLTDNSTIALGTGVHTLTFAASNAATWTAAKTLTITGWTGTAGISGTAGKIFVGTAATSLTATQLAQISFSIGGVSYSAKLLATGEMVPNVVCSTSAPTIQPASLTFNTVNKTVIDASFTGISPAANYLIVRTTGATPTNPVNGTTYTVGSIALGGTIVASTTSTSFTDTGLTANTAYTYFVYAYYLNCSGTSPVYNTTNALTKSVTTSNTANTWYVNDASIIGDVYTTAVGNALNTGLSKSSPFLTLAAAITAAAAGDIIYVDSGTYGDKSLTISKALTIIGAGTALTFFNANNAASLFANITSSNVTIKNMDILQYMYDTSGSGQVINISGAYTGIVFDNVLLNKSLGGNSTAANLNITGGANVTVKNSLFKCSGFNGSVGGGISVNASTLTVTNTIFFNNDNATGAGGAIGLLGASNLTVTNCTFDTNTSKDGGAIAIGGTSTASIIGSCFLNNKTEGSSPAAADGGGAIYSNTSGTVTITDCSFTSNCTGGGTNNLTGSLVTCLGSGNSPKGGAIRQAGGTMNLTRVSFTTNSSANGASANDIQKDSGTMTLSQIKFNTVAAGTYVNVVNTAGTLTFADSGIPSADGSGVIITKPEVTGVAPTITNTNTPSATIATVCANTASLISCGSTAVINCTTETVAPVIISCVANKTLTCPATLPDYTAEVNAYDDCSFTVTQSPIAGTTLSAGVTTVTMTVTDTHGNASTCTFTVTVSSGTAATNFGDFASAVGISTNGGTSTSFYNTTGASANLIGSSTFTANNLGSFTPSSGTLKLTGAELKTWKTNGNVCGGTLYYVVYTTGSRPAVPVFQSFAIPFKANCGTSVFGDGFGPCTLGDQKWSTSLQSIDLTAYAAGSYTIEAYYAYTGSETSSGCGVTQYLNNSCSNYTATFTLESCTAPSITTNPATTQSVCQNGTPTNLTVVAGGSATLTYQWYSNISNSTTGGTSLGSTNGAQTATYTPITNATGTIYYYCTVTNSCGSDTTTTSAVVVTAAPNAGILNGIQAICSNGLTTFISSGNTGGVFTSSNSGIATVNASTGVITPVAAGTATITYTVTGTGGCSNVTATRDLTVTASPNAGTLSGTQAICSNGTTTFISSGNTGGAFTSSNTAVASVNITTGVITPVAAGTATITYTITGTGGCSNATATRDVTVTAAPNAGTLSGTQAIYVGNTTTFNSNGNAGGIFTSSNTAIATVNSSTGLITGLAAGTVTITYTLTGTGGCSNAIATRDITISDLQTVAGTITADQNICKDSTPADLSLTGNTGSVVKWQKSTDFAFTSPIDIPSTSTTLSGSTIGSLSATTYFRAVVQNGSSTVEYTNVVTITVPTTTWNGTSWSNGEPTITTTAYMTGNYSLATDLYACTLTVSNNAVVSIPSGYDVTLYGKLTVNAGSSFTLNNNSNLIQQTNVSNTGDISVKRMSSPLYRLDYTLWSSPVIGAQTLYNFSPLTSNIAPTNIRFYIYNTLTNQYNSFNPVATTFDTAKGYLIRSPNNWLSYNASLSPAPQKWTGSFTGVPRNGDVTFTMVNTGTNTAINATGNPYPSALLISNFINGNSNNIEGTLWFWRKYNDNDNLVSYSTCSTLGCALTNNAVYTDSNLISIGQGFMVKAKAGQTNLNFNNSMRSSENVNQFFKSSSTQMDRYWVKMTNSTNVSAGQNLIAYVPNATYDYDSGLDGLYSNDSSVAFYSKAGTQDVVINARPSFIVNDRIPLIFKTNVADTYTFSLNQKEGIFNGTQDILLRDNYTNTVQNLSLGNYSFTTAIGVFSDRFEIFYQNSLGVNNSVFNSNQVIIYNQDNLTHINSGNIIMNSLKIFDVQGRLLYSKSGINDTKTSLKLGFENQILLYQITSQDGEIVTKKVIN